MSHSHLPIRHLIRHIEKTRMNGHSDAPSSKSTPAWMQRFVDGITDLFEPFSGVARVGFECAHATEAWEISVFLGEKELVGGPTDGRMEATNFRFDLFGIRNCFTEIQSMQWNAFPNSHVCFDEAADLSFITVAGQYEGNFIRLQVHATPPDCVGPAIREYADGRVEMV
ncbi:MAG: hypothetical protein KDA88_06830 [Planctomycetaceae bacterium]|nr:hypothetical protein [Planctomycetaceae bacterium]MCB9953161.1 hypothetical protein [Planctomycetaceae bacterium]